VRTNCKIGSKGGASPPARVKVLLRLAASIPDVVLKAGLVRLGLLALEAGCPAFGWWAPETLTLACRFL